MTKERLLLETQPYGERNPDDEPVRCDVVVADLSGSMFHGGLTPGRSKIESVSRATLRFLEAKRACRPQDWVGMAAYHNRATRLCGLTCVYERYDELVEIALGLPRLESGGTCLVTGLRAARRILAGAPGRLDGAALRVIAYSDGRDHAPELGLEAARRLKQAGVLVETFGVARRPQEVDERFLQGVATTDAQGCHYRFLGDEEALGEAFERAARGVLTIDD